MGLGSAVSRSAVSQVSSDSAHLGSDDAHIPAKPAPHRSDPAPPSSGPAVSNPRGSSCIILKARPRLTEEDCVSRLL